MNRLEGGSRRPSLTGGGIGVMGDSTGELAVTTSAGDHHIESPLRVGSTTRMMASNNTPIASPQDHIYKADSKSVSGIRDAKTGVPLSEEEYLGLTTPKLSDMNTAGSSMATCRQPSSFAAANMSLAPSSSKFQATSRSHSFGGPTDGFFLEREGEASSRSNPSLQYLITRARRGLGRPYSANASPLSYNGGRRHVSVDLSPHRHHRDLAKAVAELQSFQAEQPDHGDDRIRQAIVDVTNHCIRRTAEEKAETSTSISSPSFPGSGNQLGGRLKRNTSSETKRNCSEFATVTARRNTPLEGRSKSRRLSPSTSIGSEEEEEGDAAAASSEETQTHRNTLRLPDPDNLADRRQLFAMSRKMCSRSSIQSFDESDSQKGEDDSSDMRAPSGPSSRQFLQHIDVADSAIRECKMSTPCSMTAPGVGKVPSLELSVGTKSTKRLHHSFDIENNDDAVSFSSADSIMSVEEDNVVANCESIVSSILSSPPLSKFPVAVSLKSPHVDEDNGDDDDDSIAFSMDSVHMRKKQFDHHHSSPSNSPLCQNRSTRTLNQSARTLLTDWAVNGQNQVPAVKGSHPAAAPPQQIVCEFGSTEKMGGDDHFLQQRFQLHAKLRDDHENDQGGDQEDTDDDCTLASLSSLDTAPITERMEEMDPWNSDKQQMPPHAAGNSKVPFYQ